MKLYFAPMEGLSSWVYRSTHAACFPGVDRYFSPFLAPDGSGKFRSSALRDLLPENNRNQLPIPQILCSRPEPFLAVSRLLADMGYTEVNLNAGCPSPTVVPKHKGAGMLADLRSLDDFLAEVFSRSPIKVSVKTRLGLDSPDEFPAILDVYNRYPLQELIIHARVRSGFYKSRPDIPAFAAAFASARAPVCYNGNIVDRSSCDYIMSTVPNLDRIMIGRGAAANPALFRMLLGGDMLEAAEMKDFLDRLLDAMLNSGLSEYHCLSRLKELWYYSIDLFPDCHRLQKQLNKSRSLCEYRDAVDALFASGSFDGSSVFRG